MDLDMGFSRTFGNEKSSRQLFFVSLDFQRRIGSWLKVRLGGKYYHQEIQFLVDIRKESSDSTKSSYISEKEVEILNTKLDKTVLRDAYLQFNLGESLVLTAGQQTIVWGQLDLFSPVDLLLPLDFSSPLSYSKVDMRLPVTAVKLSWFPTPRLELQGYYFPKVTYSDFVKEELEKERGWNNEVVNGDGEFETRKVGFHRPKKQSHYAFRLLYYGDWATFGLTYFKGYGHLPKPFGRAFLESNVILQESKEYYCPKFGPPGGCNILEAGSLVDAVNVVDEIHFEEVEALGFEFVKPIGSYSWKIDMVSFKQGTEKRLDNTTLFEGFEKNDNPLWGPHKAYWRWVLNENDGKLHAPTRLTLLGLGFDAKFTRWNVSLLPL